jgi:hypothetical protein
MCLDYKSVLLLLLKLGFGSWECCGAKNGSPPSNVAFVARYVVCVVYRRWRLKHVRLETCQLKNVK